MKFTEARLSTTFVALTVMHVVDLCFGRLLRFDVFISSSRTKRLGDYANIVRVENLTPLGLSGSQQ